MTLPEPTSPIRVLVADDDRSIRQLLATIMRRAGLHPDCASDGFEAIALLREREYPVIVVDLMMPRMDGFGVIRHLKDHPPSVKPVVLVVTAYADQRFKEVDSDIVAGVVRKPFEIAELATIVGLCAEGLLQAVEQEKLKKGPRDRSADQQMTPRDGQSH